MFWTSLTENESQSEEKKQLETRWKDRDLQSRVIEVSDIRFRLAASSFIKRIRSEELPWNTSEDRFRNCSPASGLNLK